MGLCNRRPPPDAITLLFFSGRGKLIANYQITMNQVVKRQEIFLNQNVINKWCTREHQCMNNNNNNNMEKIAAFFSPPAEKMPFLLPRDGSIHAVLNGPSHNRYEVDTMARSGSVNRN